MMLKYLFRVYITTFMTFTLFTIDKFYTTLEMYYRIYRITIIDLEILPSQGSGAYRTS